MSQRQQPHEHKVQEWGRGLFRVSSASRKGMYHFVDIAPEDDDPMCWCEDYEFRGSFPCRHVIAVGLFLMKQLLNGAEIEIKLKTKPRKARKYKLQRA